MARWNTKSIYSTNPTLYIEAGILKCDNSKWKQIGVTKSLLKIVKGFFRYSTQDFFWQDLTMAETFYRATNLDRPGDFFEAVNSRPRHMLAQIKEVVNKRLAYLRNTCTHTKHIIKLIYLYIHAGTTQINARWNTKSIYLTNPTLYMALNLFIYTCGHDASQCVVGVPSSSSSSWSRWQ